MGPNAWLHRHPLAYILIGVVIAGIGVAAGHPIPIGVGVLLILLGLVRAFLL